MTDTGELSGRLCMITGATGGLGRAAAIAVARRGASVVLQCRDPSRGAGVLSEVRGAARGGTAELVAGDLSSPASIADMARRFRATHDRLNVLVHTAAVYTQKRETTSDGLERMFATNHLGPFLLTNLLLGPLRAGAPARVLLVSAPTTSKIDFDDLKGAAGFRPFHAFGASKMGNLLFAYALARRLEGSRVTVNVVHPGLMRTDLMREAPALVRWLLRPASRSPDRAAEALVHLASSPQLEGVTGGFFKGRKPSESAAYSRDRTVQERLWRESERLVGLASAGGGGIGGR